MGIGLFAVFLISFVALYIGAPSLSHTTYQRAIPIATSSVAASAQAFSGRQATHVQTPSAVKGIYMTACTASAPSLRAKLVKLIDDTELNAVVIDGKSYDGHISFMPKDEGLQAATKGGDCFVRDMQDFIDELHAHDIYVITRLAVFQDHRMVKAKPEWAVKKASATSTPWADYKGISWIDAGAKPYWEYISSIAEEAHAIGFDEINFDYIRFPSDGNMKDIFFPYSGTKKKSDIVRSFWEYLYDRLSPQGIVMSADVFGMTTTNTDDLNIGQILENALPNFDFIAPMVYPSHYPNNFMNLGDPNKHVYEVVNFSMVEAVKRAVATTTTVALPDARIGTSTPAIYAKPAFDKKKLRPWLQDNNYPVTYTAEMVRAQIQAAYDAGLDSWLLWNAANRYTRAALEPAP
jgi:hypothetical protein